MVGTKARSFGTKQTPDALLSKLHLALKNERLNSNSEIFADFKTTEDSGFVLEGDADNTPKDNKNTFFVHNNVTVCYHDWTERIKSPNKMKQYSNTSSKQIFYIVCQSDFHSLADFFLPLILPLPLPWIKALHNTLFGLENPSILKRKHFVACHIDKRNNKEKVTLYDTKHYLGFNTQATWAIIDAAFGLNTQRTLIQRNTHHLPTVLSYLSLAAVIALNTAPYLQAWGQAHHTGLIALLHHTQGHWGQVVLASYLAYAAGHITGYLLGRIAHRLAYTTDRARETNLGIQPLTDDTHCGQGTVQIIRNLADNKSPAEINISIEQIVTAYDAIGAQLTQSAC